MAKENNFNIRKMVYFLFISFLILGGCAYCNKKLGLPNDNPIEEAIEDIIEYKTGIEIDFTGD